MIDSTALAGLEALRAGFAERVASRVDDLVNAWVACGSSLGDHDRLEALERLAHNLAGAGATFGYREVSELARQLEVLLNEVMGSERSEDPRIGERIEKLLDALRDAAATRPDGLGDRLLGTPPARGRSERTILLVDDDADAARLLATEVEHFGYTVNVVTAAEDVAAAVERDGRPDLALLDLVFPAGEQGLEVARQLADDEGLDLPVVFLTTRDDFEARLSAVRAGARDYFIKPVDPVKLVERIDDLTAVREHDPYRVLIVEDEEILSEAYALALRAAGMVVEVVAEPRRVLGMLETFDAELILLDVYLPRCSGLELAKVIRQKERLTSIPIVFLSTEVRIDQQLLAMSLGGDDFLTKPIAVDRLVASVSSRVRRSRELRGFIDKDSMTGLLNHASTIHGLRKEIARAARTGTPFGFCILDLDRFKSINDSYGHTTGDRVIKSLARLLQQRLRQTDTIGRYGGEEFAVILPNADVDRSRAVLEELRDRFAAMRQTADGKEFAVTFSAGLAGFPEYKTASGLIEAADRALYRAKDAGRNRVEIADDEAPIAMAGTGD